MDKLETPEQLQMFFKANDRIKFSVKVFYVLQFVQKNPDYKNVCGASWCSDGKHFISNSSILGNTLSIKPNTINTNFRSHSFKIIPFKAVDLSTEFPNLPDIKNWKKRINQQYKFTNQSFVEDINLIPCQPLANLKSQKENVYSQNYSNNMLNASYKLSFHPAPFPNDSIKQPISQNCNKISNITINLPPETQLLLSNDQEILLNTTSLVNKIKINREKSIFITLCATKEWIQAVGNVSRVDPDLIINSILANQINLPGFSQLKANILYLLLYQIEATQQEEEYITFDQFLNFFLRYGSISKAANYISDLTLFNDTPTDYAMNSPIQENQCQISSQKNSFFTSQFHPWFQPSFNAAISTKMLERKPLSTWLLRPSATPGKFTVHYKSNDSGKNTVCATYIEFNPITGPNEHPFNVLIDGIGLVGADSWNSILFDIMKLNPSNALYIDPPPSNSQHNCWNDQLIEQASPFYFTPSQIEMQISSSQRFF